MATGHYCRKEPLLDSEGKQVIIDGQPQWRILEGVDPNKDQSYFLCQLGQGQLAKAMFPIGGLTKPEVRRIAHEADLPSADKKDSQGICFVGKVDLPTFLKQKLLPKQGDVVEVFDAFYASSPDYGFAVSTLSSILKTPGKPQMICAYSSEDSGGASFNNVSIEGATRSEGNEYDEEKIRTLSDETLERLSRPLDYGSIKFETETYRSGKKHIRKTRYKENPYGKIVGQHDGAQFYTIGQRKGLNIGGHKDSIFVISTDTERNIIYVGEGHTHKGLSRCCIRIGNRDIHWIRQDLEMKDGEIRSCKVRVRYRQPLQDALLTKRPNGLFIIFRKPQRGISNGQFAVWYSSDGEMLGSGAI